MVKLVKVTVFPDSLSQDEEVTPREVSRYAKMLETALKREYPEAEIDVDIPLNMGGCPLPPVIGCENCEGYLCDCRHVAEMIGHMQSDVFDRWSKGYVVPRRSKRRSPNR